MKETEKQQAMELRRAQWTYGEISERLKVSKGILSRWLHDVPYIPREAVMARVRRAQSLNLAGTPEKLRTMKQRRIEGLRNKAREDVRSLTHHDLLLLGAMAYWAEGSKTKDSIVKFTNTDPNLILIVLRWLREVCGVPESKLRFHLRIHPGEDVHAIEEYWVNKTGIPKSQFYRTTLKKSESGGLSPRRIQRGIASVVVCDTTLFYRIQGWIEAIRGRTALACS